MSSDDASARGKASNARGKSVEKRVIEYLWPDAPRDETGSIRDWKELHDKVGPSLLVPDTFFVLEIKGWLWPKGSQGMFNVVAGAMMQATSAVSILREREPEFTYYPVVCWVPKHTSGVGNGIAAMLSRWRHEIDRAEVPKRTLSLMSIGEFRERFVGIGGS